MFYLLDVLIVVICLSLTVNCQDFKCPSYGEKNAKPVPNILKLVDKQNGYYSTVEVNNKDRENLVHEYFNDDRKVGYIDLEAMNQDQMNRRYYYHETEEKIVIRNNQCTRLDLDQTEKVESVKDWFEPADIVERSEIFKDFVHFGPSVLMIYANSVSDKASFVGTELVDGRSIDHWFYCLQDDGPYIDFYFDTATSYPYRFSLFYPEMTDTGNETVQTHEGRESDYVYNFFIFKPLIITLDQPIPYPVSYGCTLKKSSWTTSLPDFTSIPKFTLDMEAVLTFSSGGVIKSTARIMKYNDVYSYEITEDGVSVRSIENPPPLGRWQVDINNGSCKYYTSEYLTDTTLVTRWPFFSDLGFNLLYYIVMKPTSSASPQFIGTIDLGSERIEEYRAQHFFINSIDAIVDYHYPVTYDTLGHTKIENYPSKIVFTKDRTKDYLYQVPDTVEVTIIDFRDEYFEIGDRFDVSGCFEDFGMYTWFQLVFSNPWLTTLTSEALVREEVQEFLTEFIPITRISDIIVDTIDSNNYVTVKLLDRIHFIEAYQVNKDYTIENPDRTVKQWRIEDCEEACTSNPACYEFSYCSDFTCSLTDDYLVPMVSYNSNCSHYSVEWHNQASSFIDNNFLSPMRSILHQIRRKVERNLLTISSIGSSAEEMFIVHGPEEIGDLSEDDIDFNSLEGSTQFLRGDEYPVIQGSRKFSSGISMKIKVDYTNCLRLCSNDDNCYSVSYCPNQNGECTMSSETKLTLETSINETTVKADGCNIYEKSFINYFLKYPGKSLVIDAASIKEDVHLTDCAKECIKSKDFNCKSFDYCSSDSQSSTNGSVCFLHVNHITTDTMNEVNISNWKFAETGCDHFSKKSDHDYRQIVAHEFSLSTEVIGTYDYLSLEDCADKCNTDQVNCYTFEYCETMELGISDDDYHFSPSSWIKATCRLSNVKPTTTSNTNDPEFKKYFDKSLQSDTICSIYVNQEKIFAKSSPGISEPALNVQSGQKDRTGLIYGLGSFFFIVAFAIGLTGFTFAIKKSLIVI